MFNFKKNKKSKDNDSSKTLSWRSRLQHGLRKTRLKFTNNLANLLYGKKTIDDELYEALEAQLLLADVGIETTQKILENLIEITGRSDLNDAKALMNHLKQTLFELLKPYEQSLTLNTKPFVLLTVGVNGAGKTTTIAKLAHFYQKNNQKVLLGAGDTFRAAAIEQLQVWGERNNVPVIAQKQNADSAAVIFDSIQAAKTRQVDLIIADTAGRLHTQEHLMNELRKIKRVIKKCMATAPHEVLLIIDASMGQNALTQAKQFHQAIGLTGIALTKLDGTAKGGIVFSIADQLNLPIRFIGVGEKIDDLQPFQAKAFIEALFDNQISKGKDTE
jgi:fused signal recognition particle receptor